MIKKNILIILSLLFPIFANTQNINQLKVPDNFEISIIAKDLNTPRQIAETTDGHLIVGSKSGSEVIALIDKNEKIIKVSSTIPERKRKL